MRLRTWFFACCVTLASACDDERKNADDDSGTSGLKSDASTDAGEADAGAVADGNNGGAAGKRGAHAGKGGASGVEDAGASGASGKSGNAAAGKGGASGNSDAGTIDAGKHDSGSPNDSGPPEPDAAQPDPCGANTECAGGCCAAGQVCRSNTATQIAVDFPNANGSTRSVAVGATVTFNWDADDNHDVQLFPSMSTFTACNFDAAQLLSESRGYVWSATAVGDFYFGCSLYDHCSDDGMKLHVAVAPAEACSAP